MISAIVLIGPKVDPILLKQSLKSIEWCDEILKIDTQKIKGSFSEWRNEGSIKAKGDWIIYLDSDEEIPLSLKNEIQIIISKKEDDFSAYAIPRVNYIFNKEFKHSGQYPDYQKRLFKKEKFKKWIGELHEEPVFNGELGHLKNSIIHHKNISISEMLEKTNIWSEIEAKLLFDAKHPKMNFVRFASAGLREFVLRFIKQKAYLDGKEGIIYGIYQIYSKLITYSKLWEKQLSTTRT